MMAGTHALVGVTVVSFAAGTADPLHLAAAALASQLPDVDTSRSLAGRLLLPLSRSSQARRERVAHGRGDARGGRAARMA